MSDGTRPPWLGRARRLADTGITLVEGLCTAAEAGAVIAAARPHLEPSTVARGEELVRDAHRTSSSAVVLPRAETQALVRPLLGRAAALAGLPAALAEEVWAVRYRPGERYRPHVDYFRQEKHADLLAERGNRIATVLLYLNDVPPESGGTTDFPRLGVRVAPRCGRALHWLNVDADGTPHPETRHEARPLAGPPGTEKWVLNAWFRERPESPAAAPAAGPRPSAEPGRALSERAAERLPEGVVRLASGE
jgi:prolyl 4-hydroxylase